MTIGYNAETARRMADDLHRNADECASTPDVRVDGGVNLNIKGVNQVNALLRSLRDATNYNKQQYAGWMNAYASRLVQASQNAEAFEEGVADHATVVTQQVDDTTVSSVGSGAVDTKTAISKTSSGDGFAAVELS